jgi:hypothetical protein
MPQWLLRQGYNRSMSPQTTLLSLPITICLILCGCDLLKGSQVEGAVIKALGADPRTSHYKFEVSAQDSGEVVITGEVSTPEEIDAVTQIASAVEGVTSVVNRCKLPEESSGMMQDTIVPGVAGGLAF